jgi:hypothetical protein
MTVGRPAVRSYRALRVRVEVLHIAGRVWCKAAPLGVAGADNAVPLARTNLITMTMSVLALRSGQVRILPGISAAS